MAIIAAATPFQMSSFRHMPMDSPAITVDERNPDYRIILNPVTDPDGRVLGVVGMILDAGFLRKSLLPEAIARSLGQFFPRRAPGHRRHGQGRARDG